MLEPEGHQGVWFEMEPEDPWEHLVWESQKYIGEPIELDIIGDEQIAAGVGEVFRGEPDVCSGAIKNQLAKIELELHPSPEEYSDTHFCGFFVKTSVSDLIGDLISIVQFDENIIDTFAEVTDSSGTSGQWRLMGSNQGFTTGCMAVGQFRGGTLPVLINSQQEGGSGETRCHRVDLMATMLSNLNILKGE